MSTSQDHSAQDHSRSYLFVLIALAVLTVITVAITRVGFGGRVGDIAAGLLVATIKASLVVMIFMHLKYEARWWASFVLFPVVLVMIIIFSNFADTGMNEDHLVPAAVKIEHKGKSGAH